MMDKDLPLQLSSYDDMELIDFLDSRGLERRRQKQRPGVDEGRIIDYTDDDFLRQQQQQQHAARVAVGVPINTDADDQESQIFQFQSLVSPSTAASTTSTRTPKRSESVTSGSTDLSFMLDPPRPASMETARAESSPTPETVPPAVPPVPKSKFAITTSLGEISLLSLSAPTPPDEPPATKKEEEEEDPAVPTKSKLAFTTSIGEISLLSLGSLTPTMDELFSSLKFDNVKDGAEKEEGTKESSASAVNEFARMYSRTLCRPTSVAAPLGTFQIQQQQQHGGSNADIPNEYATASGYNSQPRSEHHDGGRHPWMYDEERMVPSTGLPPRIPTSYNQQQSECDMASFRPTINVPMQSDFRKFCEVWCAGGQVQHMTTPRTTNIGEKKKSKISLKRPGRSDSMMSSNSTSSNSSSTFSNQKETDPVQKVYVTPNDNDILMGRGGLANNWPGNNAYLQRVLEVQVTYRQLKSNEKAKKTQLAQDVVDYVHENLGGRFLKKETTAKSGDSKGRRNSRGATKGTEDLWYIVTNHEARSKASQALRDDHSSEYRAAKRAKYGC